MTIIIHFNLKNNNNKELLFKIKVDYVIQTLEYTCRYTPDFG